MLLTLISEVFWGNMEFFDKIKDVIWCHMLHMEGSSISWLLVYEVYFYFCWIVMFPAN